MCDFNGQVKELGSVPSQLLNAVTSKLQESEQADNEFWTREEEKKPNRFPVFRNTMQHAVFGFPQSLDTHIQACRFTIWEEWASPMVEQIKGLQIACI